MLIVFNFSHEKKTMYTLDTMINKVTSMIPRMLLVIKNVVLATFGALNFDHLVNYSLQKVEKFIKIKIPSL